MKKQALWRRLCCLLLLTALALCFATDAAGMTTAKETNAARVETIPAMANIRSLPSLSHTAPTDPQARLTPEELAALEVYPGGMPFGVKFYTDGVSVMGCGEVETERGKVYPGADAGLRPKDMILSVNGEPLTNAAKLTELIEGSKGKPLALTCRRGKNTFDTTLTPVYCPAEGRYKTGIWVRDSGAGIGTVTFIRPETGAFGGLGHGICDADTGELIAMKRGSVSDVTISSVVRGAAGAPGELKGYFNAGKVGSLLGNTSCGVWGVFSELPEGCNAPMPVGSRDEIEEGDAYILSTLDSGKIGRYDIKISAINRDATGSKCFTVTVTDPDLLALSGGIVQGMSGSPIIQGGKIVGAVTHVLINDPAVGYGIFLENMLVNMPMLVR